MIEWKQDDNNLWFNTCNKSCMECDRLTWENAIIVVTNKKENGTVKNVYIIKMENVRYIKESV